MSPLPAAATLLLSTVKSLEEGTVGRGVAWLRAGSALKEPTQWSSHLFSGRELAMVRIDTGSGLTGAENGP